MVPACQDRFNVPDDTISSLTDDILDIVLLTNIERYLAGARGIGLLGCSRHVVCLYRSDRRFKEIWFAMRGIGGTMTLFAARR